MYSAQVATDAQLIDSFLSGNQKSFERIIRKYKSRVFTAANLIVRDRYVAEDIMQETFIRFFKAIHSGKYSETGKVAAYLIRIAENLAIDHKRKKQFRVTITDTAGKEILSRLNIPVETSLDAFDGHVEREKLKWAISQLPDHQREIVYLRYFADMSFKEISDYTNVNLNTCLGRMRYAVQNLKKILTPKCDSYDSNLYPK